MGRVKAVSHRKNIHTPISHGTYPGTMAPTHTPMVSPLLLLQMKQRWITLVSTKDEVRSKWEGGGEKVYFNKEIIEVVNRKKEHLIQNYDGPTDFFQSKLEQEETLSPEEKLEQIEEKEEEIKSEKQRLKEKIRERERDQKLSELEDKLRDKQDRLDSLLEGDFVSREEAEEKALNKLSDRSGAWSDMTESEIRDTRAFEKHVDELVCTEDDVEQLKKEVDRLQRNVAELNGGREDWFLELDSMEVTA